MDYNYRTLKFSVAPDCNENSFMVGQISNLSLPKLQGGCLCCWPATSYRRDQILCQVTPVSNSLGLLYGIDQSHSLLALA